MPTDPTTPDPAPAEDVEEIDADADVVAGRDRPSDRVPLDRQRIIEEAVRFIDETGPAGLSMRRLGQRLGVEAMSLYRYMPGKEDLLDAIVEHLIGGMYADPEVLSEPRDSWQDFLMRLAHGVRRVALAHAKSFPLVASRPPEAPWLRPPLRNLDWVEMFLAGLVSEGFGREAAVAAYRAFTSFLLGSLLLEVAGLGADVGPLDTIEDGSREDVSLEGHPTVKSLRDDLAQDRAAQEFDEALESLLDRIELIKVQNPA